MTAARTFVGTVSAHDDAASHSRIPPPGTGAFGRKYPGIELTLVEDETDALLSGLAAGDLHTAFLGLGPGQDPPAGLQAIVVAHEPAVLAVHPQHPLAARRSVRLSALRDEPVVTLTRASRLRTVLETECRQVGFDPRIVAETSDLTVMVQLVAEGIGVALMPRSGGRGPAMWP